MVSEMQAKNSNEIQLVVKIHRHTHMTGAGEIEFAHLQMTAAAQHLHALVALFNNDMYWNIP